MPDSQVSSGTADFPEPFKSAVASISHARFRPEFACEPMPAPQRIAPYACALSADVSVDDDELATGRLVVLFDPDGNPAWGGTFRCVAYARAEIEAELAQDPAFAAAAWTWLAETLNAQGAAYSNESGTITRVATESFGGMCDDGLQAQVEIRASWTPIDLDSDPPALSSHVAAWGDLVCMAGGLQPLPEGVSSIPNRRGQRGS